jgi:hypothetical protein
MTGTEYFVNAMVWSALGLVVGFILGMGWRVKFKLKMLTERGRERMVGAFLIALALGSMAQSLVYQRHQSQITNCQTRYNEEFQKTLQERAATSERDRKNTFDMVQGVMTAKDREQARAAIGNYIKINQEIEAKRSQQRFPQRTGRVCR